MYVLDFVVLLNTSGEIAYNVYTVLTILTKEQIENLNVFLPQLVAFEKHGSNKTPLETLKINNWVCFLAVKC